MAKSRKSSVENDTAWHGEAGREPEAATHGADNAVSNDTNGIGTETAVAEREVLTSSGVVVGESSGFPVNGKAKAPPLSKRERFLKLAPKRVNNVLKALQRLANCSGKGGYEYTAAEADKIVKAVQRAVDAMSNRFSGTKESNSFTL